jgi:hypothetical protein
MYEALTSTADRLTASALMDTEVFRCRGSTISGTETKTNMGQVAKPFAANAPTRELD